MDTPEFWEEYLTEVPICKSLIDNYQEIRNEALTYANEYNPFVDYPKYEVYDTEASQVVNLYDHYWGVIPLSVFKGESFDFIEMPGIDDFPAFFESLVRNAKQHCPKIYSMISELESDGNLANTFISRLVPGSVIKPHTGWVNDWMRIHLGLVCDPNCKLTVGNQERTWQEGKILAFKDCGPYPHSVSHNGTGERIILSIDLKLDYLRTFVSEI